MVKIIGFSLNREASSGGKWVDISKEMQLFSINKISKKSSASKQVLIFSHNAC